MKPIAGAKLTFTKADLARFNDGQKKTLYTFAHVLNRLKLFEAQVFSHWRKATAAHGSEFERDAALFGVFEFLLLLAGELKEGWEAVQTCYYGSQLSKTLNNQLTDEVQQILKRLPEHFKGTSITYRLRNDFSFHHSPEKLVSTAEILAHDDPQTAYLFDEENNYFDYATKVRIAAVAESLNLSDWRTVVEHLVRTVVGEVFRDLSHVLNAILAKILELVPRNHEAVKLPTVPSCEELVAHYFFYIVPKTFSQ